MRRSGAIPRLRSRWRKACSRKNGQPDFKYLAQLIKGVGFDLDFDEMACGGLGALEHRSNTAGGRNMIVLDQNCIIESETMGKLACGMRLKARAAGLPCASG